MLRKSPTRTEAFLAANRRNALKSTGPRTERGKARSCMNALKHGRYAKRLPEKLEGAGDHGGAALYQKVRGEIGAAFPAAKDPGQIRQLDGFATKVWIMARNGGVMGRKPRFGIFSAESRPLPISRLLFRLDDERRRIGIVYWMQRKRYWTLERRLEALAGMYPANVPTVGEALQDKLHHRVFRVRRPGLWERQRLGFTNPAPGQPDGRTGSREQGIGNSNRSQAGHDGALQDAAAVSGAIASGATRSAAGGPGDSTLTASDARSILAAFMVKLFGGA